MRFHAASGSAAATGGDCQRRQASISSSPMSRIAAPMISPRPIRKVILRKGSSGCSQPMSTKVGISIEPVRPATSAATPMRAPTSMPAPSVEVDSSIAPSAATLAEARPPPMPSAMPLPRRATERLSSAGSVRARRMFATAKPDGKVSCSRSTRIGVYSMPTPAPNMPMAPMNSISCQAGGWGRPIHTMAWISTPMPDMPATEAAAVCM